MNVLHRAMALAPLLIAASGCSTIAEGTRDLVGMQHEPVRTEEDASARALGQQLADAREELDTGISEVVTITSRERQERERERDQELLRREQVRTEREAQRGLFTPFVALLSPAPAAPDPLPTGAKELIENAEVYYHLGRLTMRSQCEAYMQELATVDSETTFGQDLANNFFDTATVAATVSQSPVIWATGLSATQNSFNSVSGSTERFLLLSESVGALRERVLQRMDDAVGTPPTFNTDGATRGTALDVARQSIEAIQRYGAPCTEGGIRQIIAEALTVSDIAQRATIERELSYRASIRRLINPEGGKASYEVSDRDLQVLLLYTGTRGETTEAALALSEQINVELPYLAGLSSEDRNQLYYFVNQIAHLPGNRLRNDLATLRQDLLNTAAQRTAPPPAQPSGAPEGNTPPTPSTPTPPAEGGEGGGGEAPAGGE